MALEDYSHLEKEIDEIKAQVEAKGDTVRSLKAELKQGKAEKADVDAAIEALKNIKITLEQKEVALEETTGIPRNKDMFRTNLFGTLQGRFFFLPSFGIYGSVAGFYDYGPPGCAIKQNLTQLWRQHFVLEEMMLEVECPAVTPYPVLKASGHVDRFTDFMVTDLTSGEPIRADHLLEDTLETLIAAETDATKKMAMEDELAGVGELKQDTLGAALKKYNCVSPAGNPVSEPFPFNLMFKTSIGPSGNQVGYLRPETAQGIFVNFRELLYYNGGKLPFAAAQIGNSYRNEISPRGGLLRVREFTQAEIEHFVDPADKTHPKFVTVAEEEPLLYSRALQMGAEKKALPMKLKDALAQGIIANETLAYFIGRTYLFCKAIGLNLNRVRFRQHLQHEMAHYAEDCWDCEVHSSHGWVECAGLADRSAYDLNAHTAASKVELSAFKKFDTPKIVKELDIIPNKKEMGKALKQDQKPAMAALEALSQDARAELKEKLASGSVSITTECGKAIELSPSMLEISLVEKKKSGANMVPGVIEPSFGIGRFIYCMFEHTYHTRPQEAPKDPKDKKAAKAAAEEAKAYFSFTPAIAPTKATVFPLLQREELNEPAKKLSKELTAMGLSNIIDISGNSIGKRYARTDELGVPFALTIDYDSIREGEMQGTCTLRERDTTDQVRVPMDDAPLIVLQLTTGKLSWADATAKFPAQEAKEE